jgi:hypothetical protein
MIQGFDHFMKVEKVFFLSLSLSREEELFGEQGENE